jgi:hypothetical protein
MGSSNSGVDLKQVAVYLVIGLERHQVNDRAEKFLGLDSCFDKIVLTIPGDNHVDSKNLVVKPWPNPTGIFRLLKLHRLKQFLDKYLFFPSIHLLFVKAVRSKLAKAIEKDLQAGKQVCVITCVPSHSICLVGQAMKRRFPQIAWIIDWQDLWSYDDNYFLRTPYLYRGALRRMEAAFLSGSDMNLTTNARAAQVLEQEYGVPSEKVMAIPHHFDRGDLGDIGAGNEAEPLSNSSSEDKPVRIGFFGTLFKPPRVPGDEVVQAVGWLRAAGIDAEIHVHGLIPTDLPWSADEMEQLGLFMHGSTSHAEGIRKLAQYDYLLLLLADLPNSRAVMSIKLPHYLVIGRPIIAIVPEQSAIADIIHETGAGHVLPVNGDWQQGLEAVLSGMIEPDKLPVRNEQAIESYSWKNLSGRWVEAIEQVTK